LPFRGRRLGNQQCTAGEAAPPAHRRTGQYPAEGAAKGTGQALAEYGLTLQETGSPEAKRFLDAP